MTLDWLLAWWNVIYVIPFFLALMYLGLYALTGVTLGDTNAAIEPDGEVEYDAAIDQDAGVDHDIAVDHDVSIDPHAGMDAHHVAPDSEASAGHDLHPDAPATGVAAAMLFWIGVGRIPITLVLMVLGLTWGAIGFAINNVARPLVPYDWIVALVSLPLALVGSTLATRTLSRLMARYLPGVQSSARPKLDLIGATGEVVLPVDASFGMISVRAPHQLHQLSCRLKRGTGPLPKGSRVLIVDFDPDLNLFGVIPDELTGDVTGLTTSRGDTSAVVQESSKALETQQNKRVLQ